MGRMNEQYLKELEYRNRLKLENYKYTYGSAITLEHIETAQAHDMTTKHIIMFGWYLCQAMENNEYHNFKYTQWFIIFVKENRLSLDITK